MKNGIHFLVANVGRACGHLTDNLPPPTFLHIAESETMQKPGKSRLIGPATHGRFGNAIIRVCAAQDSFVSFGVDPESENAPKALVFAGKPQDFVFPTGFGVAWTLAN